MDVILDCAGFSKISDKEIDISNNFEDYDNFKRFIDNHYGIEHLRKHNYIKYVKVMRQIIKIKDGNRYDKHINDIQTLINIMVDLRIIQKIDILKYMYKLESLFKIIEERKKLSFNTIKTIRESALLFKNNGHTTQFKIVMYINTLIYKYHIFVKYSKKLITLVKNLIEYEESFGIEHKLIDLNNMERSFLGKKSEYRANKIMREYVFQMNKEDNKKYYYLINVDVFKFLKLKTIDGINMKGEVDGMIISFDGISYMIEKIIEVKSSIKATYEDYHKFLLFKDYIKNMDLSTVIHYESFIFTYNSFINILEKNLYDWVLYLCFNEHDKNIIEKSHFYFFTVLKIVDDKFIKDYYIDFIDDSIIEKYKIIIHNRDMINILFEKWKNEVGFGSNNCNIYYLRND
jgi:hypothetical protein